MATRAVTITNPANTSSLAGWTEAPASSWSVFAVSTADGGHEFRASATNASASLTQDVSLAGTWTTAELDTGRWRASGLVLVRTDIAASVGELTLAALDGGGSVLATATASSPALAISSYSQALLVDVDVPTGTRSLRVSFNAIRGSGAGRPGLFFNAVRAWLTEYATVPQADFVAALGGVANRLTVVDAEPVVALGGVARRLVVANAEFVVVYDAAVARRRPAPRVV